MAEKRADVRLRPRVTKNKLNNPKMIKRDNKFLEHIKYCCSISSLHGFNQIVISSRSSWERLFWICAVMGLSIFGILKASDILEHYKERPAITSVEMGDIYWKNPFPSPVICLQSLNETYLVSHNITKDSEMYQYLMDLAFQNFTTYDVYEKYANGSRKEYLNPEEYLENLLEAVKYLTPELIDKAIFPNRQKAPIRTIITEIGICSMLNPSNAIYYTPEYINSSKFVKHQPILYSNNFGNALRCEVKEFDSAFKTAVISPNEIPDIITKMRYFPVKSLSVITVQVLPLYIQEGVKQLNIHQRRCKLFEEAEELDHSPRYTPKLCQIECRIKLCLKYCNCTPYYYRRNPGENICNMTGMYCLSKHVDELVHIGDYKAHGSSCGCLENCFETIVITEDTSTTMFIADTRLTVEIKTFSNLRYVRNLIFTKLDLVLQVGGILGLCLGCTVPGIIEMFYFMTLRMYWSVFRGRSIKNSS